MGRADQYTTPGPAWNWFQPRSNKSIPTPNPTKPVPNLPLGHLFNPTHLHPRVQLGWDGNKSGQVGVTRFGSKCGPLHQLIYMQVEVNQDQITALNTRMKKLMIVTVEKVNMATAKHKYINLNIHRYNSAYFYFIFFVQFPRIKLTILKVRLPMEKRWETLKSTRHKTCSICQIQTSYFDRIKW